MKVIFSRKGWDSVYGGYASPVFPGGRIQSLPIECSPSSPLYRAISPSAITTQGYAHLEAFIRSYGLRWNGSSHAHLDPDLESCAYSRQPGWRPCFGQSGAAAGHLDNQAVQAGDLFLFYGWFDDVTKNLDGTWQRAGKDRYVLWGWLQIGSIVKIPNARPVPNWLRYHPHWIHRASPDMKNNRVYVAANQLAISSGCVPHYSGGGVFDREHVARNLSLPGKRGRFPNACPPCIVPTKHRQEQVCDIGKDPDAANYVRSLFV
jgi:hypothetical protein